MLVAAQEVGDHVTMHLKDCLWSSQSCRLKWAETPEGADCYKFELRWVNDALCLNGPLAFPSRLLSRSEASRADTLQAILFSYQLSRYGELPVCDARQGDQVVRMTSIDENGVLIVRFTCDQQRCTLRIISDTGNQWMIGTEIKPIVTELEVQSEQAMKFIERVRSGWSRERSYVLLPSYYFVEEFDGSGVEQHSYNPSKRIMRRYINAVARLTR